MAQEVRIGIVGMGIGKENARGFHGHPRARVTALCDLDESRTAAFARELGGDIACYTDYRTCCREAPIDALFVGTPNQWHVPVAMEAVRRGKHVMITKPLADALAPARELVAAAEAAGLVNMMSLSMRFGDGVRHLGRLAAANAFGQMYYGRARSIRRSGIPDWSAGFIQAGGGAFRDMGVHVLDSAWWLMGRPRPETVSGVAGAMFGPRGLGYHRYKVPEPSFSSRFAADDYGGGLVRFADGAGLQVESFWASHQPDEINIELFGTDGGARLEPLSLYRTEHGVPTSAALSPPKGDRTVWQTLADHFVGCILDGQICDAPLRDGLIVQAMLEALLESAAGHHEVRVAAT